MKKIIRRFILIVGVLCIAGFGLHAEPTPIFDTPIKMAWLEKFKQDVAHLVTVGFTQEDVSGEALERTFQAVAALYREKLVLATNNDENSNLCKIYKKDSPCYLPRDGQDKFYPNGPVAIACEYFDACRDGIVQAIENGGQGGVGARIAAFFGNPELCQGFIDILKDAAPDVPNNWYKRSFNTLPESEAKDIAEDVVQAQELFLQKNCELGERRTSRLRLAISILSMFAPSYAVTYLASYLPFLTASALYSGGATLLLSVLMRRALNAGFLLPNEHGVGHELAYGALSSLFGYGVTNAFSYGASGLKWVSDKTLGRALHWILGNRSLQPAIAH